MVFGAAWRISDAVEGVMSAGRGPRRHSAAFEAGRDASRERQGLLRESGHMVTVVRQRHMGLFDFLRSGCQTAKHWAHQGVMRMHDLRNPPENPLDGVNVYDGGSFWHYVGFGLSDLYDAEIARS
jgi:hypothetical protein